MLFFLDESWQTSPDGKHQAGVLSAVSIKSHDFGKCSSDIFNTKVKLIGYDAARLELKGTGILRPYLFKQLQESGIESVELKLAEEILKYAQSLEIKTFASIVDDKADLDLSCADENHLERPFFFLFERINQFMNENHPDLIAKIVFDDRGSQTNRRISKAVSNFFHKSKTGKSYDKILKVPFFAISNENIGIQLADIVAYVLGKEHIGDILIKKYHALIKGMEFKSQERFLAPNGQKYSLYGFKVVKDRVGKI